ncbi:MAG: tetratricopeptide repeat protein [Gemmatimonadota bacterium]
MMNRIRGFVQEIHRRSLWQVLGIFLAASWGVLQVVQAVTDSIGLPDWTPGMAFVLLLLGLPVVLATAFLQAESVAPADVTAPAHHTGASSTATAPEPVAETARSDIPEPAWTETSPPRLPTHLFTWKNAVMGGIGAFALLGFSLIAYFVMWSTGIGPVGNLVAQGVFEEGDAVLLADFSNTTTDASLAEVVTEALRVDLGTAATITLVPEGSVSEILGLMDRDASQPVQGNVADEVAARGGFSAIIEGEVGSAGSGYILTASLRSTDGGEPLATFRRTASNEGEVIAAIDGLSQDIRERVGESLRSIRAGEPLAEVTTSSLPALRLFTEAETVRQSGDELRAIDLLEQALDIDPEFAMAWRDLSVSRRNVGYRDDETRRAATRAYELSSRLTDEERNLAVAYYHQVVTGDIFAEIRAYEILLDAYPDQPSGLNNLANAYSVLTRWEDATALLDRAVTGPGRSGPAHVNRVLYTAFSGDFDAGHSALADLQTYAPEGELWNAWGGFVLGLASWDGPLAEERALALRSVPDGPSWRHAGTRAAALAQGITGQIGAAREGMAGAVLEAERGGDPDGVVEAYVGWALMEALMADSDPRPVLSELFERDAIRAVDPAARSNFVWIPLIASFGFIPEAQALLREWEESASEEQSAGIEQVRQAVAAFELGGADPLAGAQALETLRASLQCDRCWMWEVGSLYEEAGRVDDAIAERERSLEVGQDFWFGLHRLAANLSLGRLYERKGDVEQALEHYTVYAQQMADGGEVPAVIEARERIATLQRGRLTR